MKNLAKLLFTIDEGIFGIFPFRNIPDNTDNDSLVQDCGGFGADFNGKLGLHPGGLVDVISKTPSIFFAIFHFLDGHRATALNQIKDRKFKQVLPFISIELDSSIIGIDYLAADLYKRMVSRTFSASIL